MYIKFLVVHVISRFRLLIVDSAKPRRYIPADITFRAIYRGDQW